jgi:acetyl esterase/lipase
VQGTEQGTEVAVGILQYSLAPGGKYPVQLQQAVSALGELLDSGVQPDDIVIGGDSAGGNLTMQLLGHLLRPHPLITNVELAQPLAGAFMVSPWVSQNDRSRSYRDNTTIDLITTNLTRSLATSLFALPTLTLQDQELAFPLDVDKPQFQDMSQVVKNVYVTAGKQELFLDQGVKLVESLKGCDKDLAVRFEVPEMEAHDFIVIEGANGLVGSATIRMKEWFKTLL